MEMSFFDKWGGLHVCVIAAEVIELDDKPHLLTYATDITERKRAEEQLRTSREQLRQLAARVQTVREEERAAIAREIHDELGQCLTGVKMDLSWLTGRLPKDQKALLERGDALTELLDSTISAVRDLSARLRPSVLDDLGLATAVEWQVQDLARRTGFDVQLEAETAAGNLDRDRATALFRILQEALTNVVRHAGASRISVSLRLEGDETVLVVADNGCGISEEHIDGAKSLGIVGMRERAVAFGGSVAVDCLEDGGTKVVARIPGVEQVSND
jgi:signal transduction histidine kinase